MAFLKSHGVSIVGMSTAVPKNIVSVEEYADKFGNEIVESFKKTTGINTMHRTNENQTAGDLGYSASDYLLKQLGVDREHIGVLVFVSQSPDYRRPATACVLQYRLGLSRECASFDINLGCSGFVYGNQIIRSTMMSCDAKYGLLIVAETSSKVTSADDKGLAMMFGDAGSAILYESGTCEMSKTLLETYGEGFKNIIAYAGGFRDINPLNKVFTVADGNKHSKFDVFMDGLAVFVFSINEVPKAIKKFLLSSDENIELFDFIFLHQANHMIIKQIEKKMKFPLDKIPISLDKFGNTSGVTIPLTICHAFGSKKLGKIRVLASGFGTGLSLGVTSFEMNTDNIFPIIETDEYFSEGKFL